MKCPNPGFNVLHFKFRNSISKPIKVGTASKESVKSVEASQALIGLVVVKIWPRSQESLVPVD